MKKNYMFILFFVTTAIFAQTKNENIITLIQMTGSDKLGIQVMDSVLDQFAKALPNVPKEYWALIKEKVDINSLIEMITPLYSKYYSEDEILGLINFYKSDLGQKVITVSPLMMKESMEVGQEWGKKIAEDLIEDLKEEGYISA